MTGDHNGHISDYTAICVTQRSYSEFAEENISTTLKASGGNYGGGSETLILQEKNNESLYDENSLRLYGGVKAL